MLDRLGATFMSCVLTTKIVYFCRVQTLETIPCCSGEIQTFWFLGRAALAKQPACRSHIAVMVIFMCHCMVAIM